MYKCEYCGAEFVTPDRVSDPDCGVMYAVCPTCGSDEFSAVKECARCGVVIPEDDPALCPECRKALKLLVDHFISQLSPPQVDQLDEWLDGYSIKDRESWK